MMESTFDTSKHVPAEQPQLDPYTIPVTSGWFSWDKIHETERTSLKEFFNGSSVSRTPKIYREYRDFIINKYREEPSRRLTFTEVRKSLIGDVCYLSKVFNFLEKWGLINFSVSGEDSEFVGAGWEEKFKVKVEEGAPNGVRVVATPTSLKPISVPLSFEGSGEIVDNGVKLPPLASYADVFGDSVRAKRLVCGNCGEECVSGHHECNKEGSFKICGKCFNEGKYGENKSIDDFKFIENNKNSEAVWTEDETLLLLESVLKYGGDWELVAQSVPSKSRLDCILKLIQLPFGELTLGSTYSRDTSNRADESTRRVKQVPTISSEPQDSAQLDKPVPLTSSEPQDSFQLDEPVPLTSSEPQDSVKLDELVPLTLSEPQDSVQLDKKVPLTSSEPQDSVQLDNKADESTRRVKQVPLTTSEPEVSIQLDNISHEQQQKIEDNVDFDAETEGPPLKKQCLPGNSLMKQVALISSMVTPDITAAAADAAISALCTENQLAREIFNSREEIFATETGLPASESESHRAHDEDLEMKEVPILPETQDTCPERKAVPLPLRIKAATATALGAAAARSKLLADQEEREMEHQVAAIIETQLKKLNCKVKLLDDLEEIMEKEYSLIEELEDSIISERIDVLQRVIDFRGSRWRDHATTVKS